MPFLLLGIVTVAFLISRLIPADQSAQFFGYYNTIGRFSAVLGPVFMTWVGGATRTLVTGALTP